MKNKGKKTTMAAIIAAILGLSVFIMWYFSKIDTLELAVGLSAVGIFANMITGYFAKDSTASHTFDKLADGGA